MTQEKEVLASQEKIVNIYIEAVLLFSKTAHLKPVQGNSRENYIYPVLLALSPEKKETTYHCLLTLLKSWCVF
jgi:hypothetical protein